MTQPTSPPPGWYPAPHAGNAPRYWDGASWSEAAPAVPVGVVPSAPYPPAGAVPPAPVTIRPLRGIGRATGILIAISAGTAVVSALVVAWGLVTIDRFTVGAVPLSELETFDLLSVWVSALSVIVLVATGICWWIWQYRAAVRVRAANPAGIRRSPGWHVGSWIIPVIAWWFPFQNVKDLVRSSRAAVTGSVLAWWWALWLASSFATSVSSRMGMVADTLPAISSSLVVTLAGELLLVAAAPFAWLVVRRTTDALETGIR